MDFGQIPKELYKEVSDVEPNGETMDLGPELLQGLHKGVLGAWRKSQKGPSADQVMKGPKITDIISGSF